MLRQMMLGAAGSPWLRNTVTRLPLSAGIVARFVAGETTDEAVAAARRLRAEGLRVTLDRLGEETRDRDQAARATQDYLALLQRLGRIGLTATTELSVKLSALGLRLDDGDKIAQEHLSTLCMTAHNSGTAVTVDMEDHTATDATLAVVEGVRQDFPETGIAIQAYLRRSEADCRDLAGEGSRVRLCKGAYAEAASVAFQRRIDVDRSFVRCLRILLSGDGYPMVATHDPRLIDIAGALAARYERDRGSYEFQMLYGVRPAEQLRLAGLGEKVRVYVPYGDDWYGYLVRRVAERPRNLAPFLRSLGSTT